MSEELVRLLRRHIMEAWDSLFKDDDLRSKGKVNRDGALLVMHFLEHAHIAHSCPPNSVAIVTTHEAQMLWLLHCVWCVGKWLHGDQGYECVQIIATLDRYQGLQARVVLGSLLSPAPGIMKDVLRVNTLTSRAQPELHLFGPLLGWASLLVGWVGYG